MTSPPQPTAGIDSHIPHLREIPALALPVFAASGARSDGNIRAALQALDAAREEKSL